MQHAPPHTTRFGFTSKRLRHTLTSYVRMCEANGAQPPAFQARSWPHLQYDVGVARAKLAVHLGVPFFDLQFLWGYKWVASKSPAAHTGALGSADKPQFARSPGRAFGQPL